MKALLLMQDDPDRLDPESPVPNEDAANMMKHALSDTGMTGREATSWEPPQPEELAPLMKGYSIERILGRGGMGAVYHGIQENLDREVAIKLLPPELGKNPEFEARFKREAKSMAKLNHPNIVQIFDFGITTAGHHFIVMEYVEGTDLHQLIRTRQLGPEGALNAISQICDALEYAHSEGFVHRDIKPANMFINSKGILKVGDFGLAKLVEEEASPVSQELMGLTMTGVAMGTPHYIAPEQLEEGAAVDQRADIYSLGIMFYEMLTGEIPRGAVKSPSEKTKSLDVRIDGVVFKAMESDPGDRYQTATDLRTDVDVIRTTTPVSEDLSEAPAEPDPIESSKRRPVMGLICALLGVFVVVGAAYVWMRSQGEKGEEGPQPAIASTNAEASDPDAEKKIVAFPPLTSEGGSLHGLVYDATLKKAVPLDIPSGWKHARFHSIGAVKANGDTLSTAFSYWAIRFDGQLLSRYNGRDMVGLAQTPEKLVSYHQKVGVTQDGALIAGPGYTPHPQGYGFVDAKMAGRFAMALTETGDVHLWPAVDNQNELFHPPAEVLSNVQAIGTTKQMVMVLSSSGKVTRWSNTKGILHKELSAQSEDIVKISSIVALSRDGKLNSVGYQDQEFNERIVDLNYGSRMLALQFESGEWKLIQRSDTDSEAIAAVIEAFEATPKNRVLKVFVDAETDNDSAIVMWLEEGVESRVEGGPKHFFPAAKPETSSSPVIQSASREEPFVNSLGMSFVPVPIAGGKTDGETILFSAWETRVSDFEEFTKTDPSIEWLETDFPQEPDHPAVRIQWASAVAFCQWLTERDRASGLLKDGEYYRLPTDHEWSCAAGIAHLENPDATPEVKECRISNLYPWGKDFPPPHDFANYYGEETADNLKVVASVSGVRSPMIGFKDQFSRTAPVGTFEPNAYGLYNLHGNAHEWCHDWRSILEEKKTLRGASWGVTTSHTFLTSSRVFNSPTIRFDSHGFRCVLVPGEP